MEKTKNSLLANIFRQIFAFGTVVFGALGTTVLLFTYMFGVFTDGEAGISVVGMFMYLINVFIDFSWESVVSIIVGVLFIPSTVVMIKSFVKAIQKFVSFLKTYCKKDVAGYVSFCRSMRELIYTTFLNCFILLTAGYVTVGLVPSSASKTALIFLFIGYIFANVGLIFWQKRLPCTKFIISEVIRCVAVPLILISVCKLALKPELFVSFGRGVELFFGNSSILANMDTPEELLQASSMFFSLVAEPVCWIVSWLLAYGLVKATAERLSNLDRSYEISADPLHPKFLSFAIYTAVWAALKCSAGVFLTQNVLGNLANMGETEEILLFLLDVIKDCFELIRYDYLPIIFFCVGTYVLLYAKFDKYETKLSVADEQEDLAEAFQDLAPEDEAVTEASATEEDFVAAPVAAPAIDESVPAYAMTAEAIAKSTDDSGFISEDAPVAEAPKAEPAPKEAPAPKKAFCRFCGGQIERGSKFCSNCGAKLD